MLICSVPTGCERSSSYSLNTVILWSTFARKIRSLLGSNDAVVAIHGGLSRDERRKVEELFNRQERSDPHCHRCSRGGHQPTAAHLLINYDLPWNPNRIEQRFGRIHRIGQTEVCHMWNLVASETRVGMVFQRLFEKLDTSQQGP